MGLIRLVLFVRFRLYCCLPRNNVQKLWAILLCFLLFMLFKFMFCRTLREY